MVPTVVSPPTILSTLQVAPLTDAVNCCVCVEVTTAARNGDTVTAAVARDDATSMMEMRAKRRELRREPLDIPASRKDSTRHATRATFSYPKCTLFCRRLD